MSGARNAFVDCGEVDAAVAADEAALAAPAGGLPRYVLLLNLARSLYSRHRCDGGAPRDLERAIATVTQALEGIPAGSPDREVLEADLRMYRLAHAGTVPDDLVSDAEAAVWASRAGTPDRGLALGGAAAAYYQRFERDRALSDLDAAIARLSEAITLVPLAERDGVILRCNLFALLTARTQYRLEQANPDAERAVALLDDIFASANGTWVADQPAMIANLTQGLQALYIHSNDVRFLDWHRRLTSERRASPSSNELGGPLRARGFERDAEAMRLLSEYNRTGTRAYLEDAVAAQREAVETVPQGDPKQAEVITNLATLLELTHRQLRVPGARDEAIALARRAAGGGAATAATGTALAQLGECLLQRHRDGLDDPTSPSTGDLDEALAAYQQAVRLVTGDLAKIMLGFRVAYILAVRAVRDDNRAEADRAVAHVRDAYRALPAGFPLRISAEFIVTDVLCLRADLSGRPADAEEAHSSFQTVSVAGLRTAARPTFEASAGFAIWAWRRGKWAWAAEAYGTAVRGLHGLAAVQLVRDHAEDAIRQGEGLAARAALATVRAHTAGDPVDPTDAAVALETGRALLLSAVLERDRADLARLDRGADATLAARFRDLARELDRLDAVAAAGGLDEPTAASLGPREALQREFDEVVGRIRRVEGYETFLRPPDAEALRRIARRTPLVYLAATDGGGVAVVVDGARTEAVELPALTLDEVRRRTDAFLAAADGDYRRRYDPITVWMWDAAMGTVARLLRGRPNAVLVATGRLALLPLHAASPTGAGVGQRYLLDDLAVRYAPNARAAQAASAAARSLPAAPALVVTQPDPRLAAEGQIAAARTSFASETLPPLAGSAATRQAVTAALADAHTALFACHGRARLDRPLDSGLRLADGELTVRELMGGEPLALRVAILCACESARVGTTLPDEVVGLPAGLLQAGAAGVVGTLWPIRGSSGPVALVARFLHLWRSESMPPALALRAAQLWLRDTTNGQKADAFPHLGELAAPPGASTAPNGSWGSTRAHAHPLQWAAYVYLGA